MSQDDEPSLAMEDEGAALPEPDIDLYDEIMSGIEPELTHAELKNVRSRFEQDSPEQRKVRSLRYKTACEHFHQALERYSIAQQQQISSRRKRFLHYLEHNSVSEDNSVLSGLESLIRQQ